MNETEDKRRVTPQVDDDADHDGADDAMHDTADATFGRGGSLLPPLQMQSALPIQPWNGTWERSDMCLFSRKLASAGKRAECKFCPNVVRHDRLHLQPTRLFIKDCPAFRASEGDFICAECEADVHTNFARIQEARDAELRQTQANEASAKLQATFRRRRVLGRFALAKKGVSTLAAACRGKLGRQVTARASLASMRPVRLVLHSAKGLRAADLRHASSGKIAERGISDPLVLVTWCVWCVPLLLVPWCACGARARACVCVHVVCVCVCEGWQQTPIPHSSHWVVVRELLSCATQPPVAAPCPAG
jgi:hypothetical protein